MMQLFRSFFFLLFAVEKFHLAIIQKKMRKNKKKIRNNLFHPPGCMSAEMRTTLWFFFLLW